MPHEDPITLPELHKLLTLCFTIIEVQYADTPDIYRASGNQKEVANLFSAWKRGEQPVLRNYPCSTLTSLVKMAVRSVMEGDPEVLLPRAVTDAAYALYKTKQMNPDFAPRAQLHKVFSEFTSAEQRNVLFAIFTHLKAVVRLGSDSSPAAMAICWGPTLAPSVEYEPEDMSWFMRFVLENF